MVVNHITKMPHHVQDARAIDNPRSESYCQFDGLHPVFFSSTYLKEAGGAQ
jgi:hypothetical protein